MSPSYLPVTVDGSDIEADAPRSQAMTDQQAADLKTLADEYRALVLHLHADVTGRDVTLTGANCPQGTVLFVFGDGSADVETRDENTPEVTHTYPHDGVFTAQLVTERGDRAQLEIAINHPEAP